MRTYTIFLLTLIGVFLIDQGIKDIFLNGYEFISKCISLELHLNYGVAFSLFAFLGKWLKWLQLALIVGIFVYIFYTKTVKEYPFSIGLILGGAIGNLYDRFIHGGVVDYVAWHCGFNFAVFNFADVMIDLGVGLILFFSFLEHRKSQKESKKN